MGRGMVILTLGAIIVLGIIKMGMYDQRQRIQGLTSEYAMDVQAKNTSHSAIQLAMEKINQDPSWNPTQNDPWELEIDGSHVELYYEVLSTGATVTQPDTIRIYSRSWYGGVGSKGTSSFKNTSEDHTVISTYLKIALHYVPEPRGGLGLGTSNFTFSMGGSSTINGNDASGTCDDLPAIATPSFLDQTKVTLGTSDLSQLQSTDQKVSNDPDMSYEPVDELIARLSTQPGVKSISGNYKGDFGSADDPGIFFVESYAKLTGGIPEGYGILVIRSGGELEYEGGLSVAGNFTFNGLIVFENAFDFDGKGTPDLNGSVLIGNTPGNSTTIDIDLGGNLQIQYDCKAIDYARIAAAEHLKQNRYILVSTFE